MTTPPMTPLGSLNPVSYFKRYKMELDLCTAPPLPPLPSGYHLVPWHEGLINDHAEVLFRSFEGSVDALVFPSLGDRLGCHYLMCEISRKAGFLAGATWLVRGPDGPCGSVQGLRGLAGLGAIQNVGIIPGQRGLGLGTALLLQALDGFRQAGLHRGMLEVTSQNEGAIRLYRRMGFRRRKTIYKTVPC